MYSANFIARRVIGPCLAAACLSGCGTYFTYEETVKYKKQQAKAVSEELAKCHVPSTDKHLLDHSPSGSNSTDCYAVVVDAPARSVVPASAPSSGEPVGAMQQQTASSNPELTPADALANAATAREVVDQVAWMALLANMSYRSYVPEGDRNDEKKACDYPLQDHPLQRLNAAVERASDGQAVRRGLGRWELWKSNPLESGESVGCFSRGGLFFETYVYRPFLNPGGAEKGKFTRAVIVYRGTENYRGQATDDWWANLSSAFNIPPPQFRQVQQELPKILQALRYEGAGNLKIYAAGHSLGGSLAQLSAYMKKDVTAAFVFNTSPVTGWSWLRAQGEGAMEKPDPQIVRVLQDGEVLGFVRTFSNAANTVVRRHGRTDVYFDFPSSRKIAHQTGRRLFVDTKLHSMTLLACNLAARVASGGDSAAFDFTREMAAQATSERTNSCTPTKQSGDGVEGLCEVSVGGLRCKTDWLSGEATCDEAPTSGTEVCLQL